MTLELEDLGLELIHILYLGAFGMSHASVIKSINLYETPGNT